MLDDDSVRLQHADGSLPRVAVVAGATSWDDLLFRGFWLLGWEVQVLPQGVEVGRAVDLVVLAPTSGVVECQVPSLAATAALVDLASRSREPAYEERLTCDDGLLEILRRCEAMVAPGLNRVSVSGPDAWLAT